EAAQPARGDRGQARPADRGRRSRRHAQGPRRRQRGPAGGWVMTNLKITQVKSQIGGKQYQRDTLRTLGLRRIGQSVGREGRPEGYEGGTMPLIRRVPKLKGFKNPFRVEYQVVNLGRLAELYPEGGEVTPEDLASKGAVRSGRPVKILGTGDISVTVQVKAHA